MLQKLRDRTQGTGSKILVGVLVFVLAVFGFGAFNLFSLGGNSVAEVNGVDISPEVLANAAIREQRKIALELGEDYDPNSIDLNRLQKDTLDLLVAKTLLLESALDLGLNINPELIDNQIRSNEVFHIDGRYNEDVYRNLVRNLRYTPIEFIQESRDLAILAQMELGIASTTFVTEDQLSSVARLVGQTRDLAFLEFNPEIFQGQVRLDPSEVLDYYNDNLVLFKTLERLDISYIELTLDDVIDGLAAISEQEITQAVIEAEESGPRAREASHILIEVNDQRDVQEALERISAIREEAIRGAEFAKLATQYSEDVGTAAVGGFLGLVEEGTLGEQLESALWILNTDETSSPIITSFGVHLIRADGALQSGFSQSRDEIAAQLRVDRAELVFEERLREMDSLAFEEPYSLDPIAKAFDLRLQRQTVITNGSNEEPFASSEVQELMFSSEVFEDGFNSSVITLADGTALVFRIDEIHEPKQLALEDVRDEIIEKLVLDAARVLASSYHQEALGRLTDGEGVSVVARDYGVGWETFEGARRGDDSIPPAIRSAAFQLPSPETEGKSIGTAYIDELSPAIVTVTKVTDGNTETMSESNLQGLRQVLLNRAAGIDFDGYFQTLLESASIDRDF